MLVGWLFSVFLVSPFPALRKPLEKKKTFYPDEGNNCLRKARVNNGIDCYTYLSLANSSGRTVQITFGPTASLPHALRPPPPITSCPNATEQKRHHKVKALPPPRYRSQTFASCTHQSLPPTVFSFIHRASSVHCLSIYLLFIESNRSAPPAVPQQKEISLVQSNHTAKLKDYGDDE